MTVIAVSSSVCSPQSLGSKGSKHCFLLALCRRDVMWLLFLNWKKSCRESRLKNKRIMLMLGGRILGLLSGEGWSAAAPENCSSCKGRDTIWLLHCCRDPVQGWFELMWSSGRTLSSIFTSKIYLPAQGARSHGSCCFRLRILLKAFGDHVSLHPQVTTLASAYKFTHTWVLRSQYLSWIKSPKKSF